MRKIRKTKIRTLETTIKYAQYRKKLLNNEVTFKLEDPEKRAIKKFKYWVIVENDFPYDEVAKVSHLLFTKRKVEFNWKKLTKEEKEELEDIKDGYLAENYDVVWENLPNGRSLPGRFHLHVLKMIVEEFEV